MSERGESCQSVSVNIRCHPLPPGQFTTISSAAVLLLEILRIPSVSEHTRERIMRVSTLLLSSVSRNPCVR